MRLSQTRNPGWRGEGPGSGPLWDELPRDCPSRSAAFDGVGSGLKERARLNVLFRTIAITGGTIPIGQSQPTISVQDLFTEMRALLTAELFASGPALFGSSEPEFTYRGFARSGYELRYKHTNKTFDRGGTFPPYFARGGYEITNLSGGHTLVLYLTQLKFAERRKVLELRTEPAYGPNWESINIGEQDVYLRNTSEIRYVPVEAGVVFQTTDIEASPSVIADISVEDYYPDNVRFGVWHFPLVGITWAEYEALYPEQ